MMNKAALSIYLFGMTLTLTGCVVIDGSATRSSYFVYDATVNDSPPAHSISEDTTPPTTLIQEQNEIQAIDEQNAIEEQQYILQQKRAIPTEIYVMPVDNSNQW